MNRIAYIVVAALLCSVAAGAPEKDRKKGKSSLPKLIYRSNGIYSIIEAAAVGNEEVVTARIKEGADVNARDENGDTALHHAVLANSSACVQALIKAGADTLITNAKGKIAAQVSQSEKIVKILKRATQQRKKEIELCEAVTAGNMEPLKKAMAKKGFNANMLDKENKLSLLMLVCQQDDISMVKALLKAGANVNFVSPDSRSVLHKAVDKDNEELITTLLEAGADPMAKAGNAAVPMHDAVWTAKTSSIKALMPAYKDVNFSPPGGFNGTPINLAIDRNFPHVVQLFIDAGIDLNDNKHGDPPLVHAAETGKAEIISLLLKAGASKEAKSREGKTAVQAATDAVRNLF